MKSALFLGAGASVFANMPDTKELMHEVRERVQKLNAEPDTTNAVPDYIAKIVLNETYGDVEKLYDGIERIINTNVGNCRPITEYMGVAGTANHETLVNRLIGLQDIIRRIMLDKFRIEGDVSDAVEHLYGMVRSVMEHDNREEFLVFTTNYDMLLESYADEQNMAVVNGFTRGGYLGRVWADRWDTRVDEHAIHLIKLHGSINWSEAVNGGIEEIGGIQDRDHDIMIAPTEGDKDYTKEPFQALMRHFEDVLRHVDVLLVIGFSFRDEAIVAEIKKRLNAGMVLISVSPTATEDIREHVSNLPPIQEDEGMDIHTVGPNIIACKQEFGLENDMLYQSLVAAYEVAKEMLKFMHDREQKVS